MLAERYLERAPDPTDGRQAKLRITPDGRALHERISTYLRNRQEEVLSNLSADERATLSRILKKAALNAASLDE